MSKLTRSGFHALHTQAAELMEQSRGRLNVLVCAGTGCIASGAMKVYDYLRTTCQSRGIPVAVCLKDEAGKEGIHLKKSGCHGFCEIGPLVCIEPLDILYAHVKVEDCDEIIEKTILSGEVIERLLYTQNGVSYQRRDDIPFYKNQHRVVLKNSGKSDAEDMTEYLALGGYTAFEKALFTMTGEEICREIANSGLRGRGGGGFPAGRKWESVRRHTEEPVKYIVCNGDEGDPGAFMDQGVMEGNPHSVLEGMMIAGVATGATEGYIYVRAEYPLAVKRLQIAIEKATEIGLLGDDIMGSGFSFHIHINRGAGAFVCGEGSALTASIEGKRGMPRVKPPRTVDQGLWGKPTVLNNVETFANVPGIINHGAQWYKGIGTESSAGTKTFALTGNVVNTGLVEVPMGTTLREIIFDIGGGIPNGKKFKAVQMPDRGASGLSHGLRLAEEAGRHHRLRRTGGHGRGHLHGGGGAVLHALYPEGELRQVYALPGGHEAHAGDAGADHRQRGKPRRSGAAGGAQRYHHRHGAVRSGTDGLQAGHVHAAAFQAGLSAPCGGSPLSCMQRTQTAVGDQGGSV